MLERRLFLQATLLTAAAWLGSRAGVRKAANSRPSLPGEADTRHHCSFLADIRADLVEKGFSDTTARGVRCPLCGDWVDFSMLEMSIVRVEEASISSG
jgi:hypothetical protein